MSTDIWVQLKPFIYEARESSLVPEGFLTAKLLCCRFMKLFVVIWSNCLIVCILEEHLIFSQPNLQVVVLFYPPKV